MKQELKNLKELMEMFSSVKKEYVYKRDLFENCASLLPINLEYLDMDENTEVGSIYEVADIFYDKYDFIVEYANNLKKEHPRYGELRFKNTLIENVINNQGWDYEESYAKASYLVDIHLAFEEFGYFEAKDAEKQVLDVVDKINANTDVLTSQTFGAVKGAGKAVVNVLKPYGEVAKGQLEVAGQKAKGIVNKGTKSLVKVLEKVVEKTNVKK